MTRAIDRDGIAGLHAEVLAALAAPGDWWDGESRRAAMEEARSAATCELCASRRGVLSPEAIDASHDASGALSGPAVEVIHRVVNDSGRLTRRWADTQIAALGDAVYAELVAVTAMVVAVDVGARSIGAPAPALHVAVGGDPARERPDGLGDVGAWIPMSEQKVLANVSRALSLVPRTNVAWRALVNESYSRGPQMLALTWERALTRPQVELVAARVSQLNECFY
ncbi:MAG: alkylhydroperoxidase-related (seleno)protein [Ilumatobacteraceae bacterium]